ncbi:MAG: hypothetical protein K5927_04780 [Lachnospiraceae bacterium]|nr:hypothetical protein [Lachnospiraceae bacterium]
MDMNDVITSFVDFCGLDYELTEEMFEIDRDILEIRNDEATDGDETDNILKEDSVDVQDRSNEYGVFGEHIISGVSHNLQGASNCVATAAANVIWYHGTHGFSYMIGSNTWTSVRNIMNSAYQMAGGFANNNTGTAIDNFFSLAGTSPATIAVNVTWNTSSSYMRNEIDHSRPCMLGFVAGVNSYSQNHMTMCYGYKGINYMLYSVLADGHQSVPVYKLWDTAYNDCTIRISVT